MKYAGTDTVFAPPLSVAKQTDGPPRRAGDRDIALMIGSGRPRVKQES